MQYTIRPQTMQPTITTYHSYCAQPLNLAPAPAATIMTGSAAPAQPHATEAKDPCSIEAVGEDFPRKSLICKVVLLF